MSGPLMAARRDASWHNRPDCYTAKMYHVLTRGPDARPACGRLMMPNDDDTLPAADAPEEWRCQRNGCRQLWPTDAAASAQGEVL